jgi:hypothetical protein
MCVVQVSSSDWNPPGKIGMCYPEKVCVDSADLPLFILDYGTSRRSMELK